MTEPTKQTERRYTLTAAREAGYRVLERMDDDMALQSAVVPTTRLAAREEPSQPAPPIRR